MIPLTRAIGEFAAGLRYQDIPDSAVRIVCNGFTDVTACIVLGSGEPVVEALRRITVGSSGEASICFGPHRTSPTDASLINGTAAHAHDYDDIGIGAHPAHPSAVLVPAILAEAEATGGDGQRMIAAYVAGYETWGELARRDADPHHLKGLHPTGVFGGIAAAAACANLLGLDADRAAHAIGIAATQGAGLVANFGSMAKPFHAGRAAQVGVMSARLAAQGMTATEDVIEQSNGFLHVVSPRGNVDVTSPLIFGREWWILRYGLGFKLYPMCYGAHRSLDGMLTLVAEHDIAPGDVADVEVEMSPNQQINLVNHDPKTATAAKFSEEFAMAAAIIARRATRAELTDEFVRRDDVRALMKKVHITTIPGVGDDRPTSPPADWITVVLANGRRLQCRLEHPRGHPTRPLSGEDLWTKFADCVSAAMPTVVARSLFHKLQALSQLKAANELSAVANASSAVSVKQGKLQRG